MKTLETTGAGMTRRMSNTSALTGGAMKMKAMTAAVITGIVIAAAPFATQAAGGQVRHSGNGTVHKVMEKVSIPVAGNNGKHIGWCWGLGNIGLSNGKGKGVQLVETDDGRLINKHGIDVSNCAPELR